MTATAMATMMKSIQQKLPLKMTSTPASHANQVFISVNYICMLTFMLTKRCGMIFITTFVTQFNVFMNVSCHMPQMHATIRKSS
jgi:hypothetical protein